MTILVYETIAITTARFTKTLIMTSLLRTLVSVLCKMFSQEHFLSLTIYHQAQNLID